ncbi:unnamed protein product [Toxocara canis]|uniref:Uncharacterized protein n=1 Tax=Toxocara canis TaxID=6265 RepID=A0A183UMK2_TOXCA|nr:unnamed protein product [Toxocara canis]
MHYSLKSHINKEYENVSGFFPEDLGSRYALTTAGRYQERTGQTISWRRRRSYAVMSYKLVKHVAQHPSQHNMKTEARYILEKAKAPEEEEESASS